MKLRNFRRTEVSGATVSRVSELILRGEPLTRREIAERANVSVMTAGKIVDAYREAGLLEETAELIPVRQSLGHLLILHLVHGFYSVLVT